MIYFSFPMDEVIRTINSLNQRGGRMLSITDLVIAGTLTVEQAAFFIEQMQRCPSILTGAVPGGAGKTTLLGALLGLLPADAEIITIENEHDIGRLAARSPKKPTLCLVHEISPGKYYSYLWGRPLQGFFRLQNSGYSIAATIHADLPDQIYAQVMNRENNVSREDMALVDYLLFIMTKDGWTNREHRVDGIYAKSNGFHEKVHRFHSKPELVKQMAFLTSNKILFIEEVRSYLLQNEFD